MAGRKAIERGELNGVRGGEREGCMAGYGDWADGMRSLVSRNKNPTRKIINGVLLYFFILAYALKLPLPHACLCSPHVPRCGFQSQDTRRAGCVGFLKILVRESSELAQITLISEPCGLMWRTYVLG